MNLQAEIEQAMRERDTAWAVWEANTDDLLEKPKWMAYQAACAKLDALYAMVKREKMLA